MIDTRINKVGFFALLIVFGVALIPTAQAGETDGDGDSGEQAILERIKPVGKVCIKGQPCGGNASTATGSGSAATTTPGGTATADAGPRSGEAIYTTACSGCHGAAAVALGAPRQGNAGDWEPRLAKGGKEQLLANAIKGLNAMPPKGTCMDCTDTELAAAVDYMLAASPGQ